MKGRTLAREVVASTWASKVTSTLILIVAAVMCIAAIVTVGRSAAAAADVRTRLDEAGARRLVVVDKGAAGFINQRTVDAVSGLSNVDEATALGVPFDAVNGVIGRGGTRVPVWPVLGSSHNVVDVVLGRDAHVGEVLVSVAQLDELGLAHPAGFVSTPDGSARFPVVGAYRARAPHADVDAGAILVADETTPGRELRVIVTDIESIDQTVATVLSILGPEDVSDVLLDSPAVLAGTARDIDAQLQGYGRRLLSLILAAGGLFVASVVLADVLVRRRDLGRRRTLGITRSDLVQLVTGRAVLAAAIGATLGCSSGWSVNVSQGVGTPVDFVVAVGVLASLAALVSAVPPAVYASRLDPVVVMRTP